MDGQQRLSAIIEFYENRFKLSSLESWKIVNGKSYGDLPDKVQRGLDRRRISATVIISDLTDRPYGPEDVRRQVFDRLNTGGMPLNAQELRNCLYPGYFNTTLIRVSSHSSFTTAFSIPSHKENITTGNRVSDELAKDTLYKRLGDCELALRFFTFRRSEGLRRSIPKALDWCMLDYQDISESEVADLENLFLSRLELSLEIFGKDTFYLPNVKKGKRPSTPLYDATMIAIDRLYDHRAELVRSKKRIKMALAQLLEDKENYETIIGKPGTAKAIRSRINMLHTAFANAAGV